MVRRVLMFTSRHPAATALTVVGLVLGVILTRDMTATFDSVRYANVGHWIAQGEGISSSVISMPLQEGTRPAGEGRFAFTLQPPGLPLYYALTGSGHWQASHRFLHVLCYGALALLVLQLARAMLGRELPAVVVVLAVLFSPPLVSVLGRYWTDLPFAVLLLGSLWAVVRAGESDRNWWRWLLLASLLAALATGFRLTGLALGLVFLADGIRGAIRRGVGHGLLRLLVLGSVVIPVAAAIFERNLRLAGTLRGVAPHDPVLTMESSLVRAWIFMSGRLVEAFVPGFAAEKAAGRIDEIGAEPGAWLAVGILPAILVLAAGVILLLRWRGKLSWPIRPSAASSAAGWYAALLVAGSLAVLVATLARQPEIHIAEQRYLVSLLPLLWVPVAAALCGSGRRMLDTTIGATVVAAFVVGVFFPVDPGGRDPESIRTGLDWIAANIPVEAIVLTNAGKELVEENPARRVYHLSDWFYRAMLPEEMRSDRSLRRWAKEHGVTHIVMVGRPSERQAEYWGPVITHLTQGLFWPDQLQYRDGRMRVFRMPRPGERARSGKGGAGR
ncbi:MAG: hypothetical protein GY838_07385 [bacterium]|nr:hypothetical protein [bacterium]